MIPGPALHGRLAALPHPARALRGNALGDPEERRSLVYVPPGEGRFPVVMLLPGFAATHRSMVGYRLFEPSTVERFDAQVAAGECPPALLVLPDAMTRWGGSQFLDSAATGRYQTHLAEEVFPDLDAAFPTIPKPEARAVAGRSSGGFGALRLAMDRPGVVGAIGSHAGDALFDVSMRPMLTSAAIAIDLAGGLEAFCASVDAKRLEGGPGGTGAFDALFVLASSAAYAPEPGIPRPHCALPMDPRSGELVPEVWARWLDADPVVRLAKDASARANVAKLQLVQVDAGNRDEHGLHFAARRLAAALGEAGAKVAHEEFEGGHRGTSWRYMHTLPALIGALEGG
ncbi:MAG: alpha/beta hydrolase-fold protein [Myxococcota bacterium]